MNSKQRTSAKLRVCAVTDKKLRRSDLNKHIKKFLADGGEITLIPTGLGKSNMEDKFDVRRTRKARFNRKLSNRR